MEIHNVILNIGTTTKAEDLYLADTDIEKSNLNLGNIT